MPYRPAASAQGGAASSRCRPRSRCRRRTAGPRRRTARPAGARVVGHAHRVSGGRRVCGERASSPCRPRSRSHCEAGGRTPPNSTTWPRAGSYTIPMQHVGDGAVHGLAHSASACRPTSTCRRRSDDVVARRTSAPRRRDVEGHALVESRCRRQRACSGRRCGQKRPERHQGQSGGERAASEAHHRIPPSSPRPQCDAIVRPTLTVRQCVAIVAALPSAVDRERPSGVYPSVPNDATPEGGTTWVRSSGPGWSPMCPPSCCPRTFAGG